MLACVIHSSPTYIERDMTAREMISPSSSSMPVVTKYAAEEDAMAISMNGSTSLSALKSDRRISRQRK